MTEKTITFTPKAELKKGFTCLFKGFVLIIKAIGKLINHAVCKYPWLFIVLILLVAILVSFVFIGKARSERDAVNKQNYELQQKIDTLQMIKEAKEEARYVYNQN